MTRYYGTEILRIAYDDRYLDWQLGDGHPTNPERAKLATDLLTEIVPHTVVQGSPPGFFSYGAKLAKEVHGGSYVDRVADGDISEADVASSKLGMAAMSMFYGTAELVFHIEQSQYTPRVSFNPQGAKHHAMPYRSSGFCALNDMAWAALHFARQGKRVAYLDWDVHHGDGVEAMTKDADAVVTYSIHQQGIFPGTGLRSEPELGVYNRPLIGGAGDEALLAGVRDALRVFGDTPDVLLLAAGADGLTGDPLAALEYTIPGLCQAAQLVGSWAARLGIPVLVGGAGGYQPMDETPVAWAGMVATLWQAFNPDKALTGRRRLDGGLAGGLVG